MNVVILSGYLGRDLDIRVDREGRMTGETSIANEEYIGVGENNQPRYVTTWTNILIRGEKRCMALSDELWSGRKVTVKGRLASRPYKVNEEKKVTTHYVEVDEVDFDRHAVRPPPKNNS